MSHEPSDAFRARRFEPPLPMVSSWLRDSGGEKTSTFPSLWWLIAYLKRLPRDRTRGEFQEAPTLSVPPSASTGLFSIQVDCFLVKLDSFWERQQIDLIDSSQKLAIMGSSLKCLRCLSGHRAALNLSAAWVWIRLEVQESKHRSA